MLTSSPFKWSKVMHKSTGKKWHFLTFCGQGNVKDTTGNLLCLWYSLVHKSAGNFSFLPCTPKAWSNSFINPGTSACTFCYSTSIILHVGVNNVFLQKLKLCREGPVKSTETRWGCIGYPATERDEKERQRRLHYIHCRNVLWNSCIVVFLVFFTPGSIAG